MAASVPVIVSHSKFYYNNNESSSSSTNTSSAKSSTPSTATTTSNKSTTTTTTSTANPTTTTPSPIDTIFLHELPFFPHHNSDPILNLSADELLLNGFQSSKLNMDGFINFHHLKLCSSNAKQMAKYLILSMGFKEIAYKGLENDSRLVGSHVISNGDVILEIVNTLETIEDDNVLKLPYFQKDLLKFKEINNLNYLNDFKISIDDLVFDFVNNRIESFSHHNTTNNNNNSKNISFNLGKKIYHKILNSKNFKNSIDEYNNFILNTINNSELIYNDIMECSLIQKFLKTHCEGVMDISFLVENVDQIFEKSIKAGAGIIRLPRIIEDKNGSIKLATITIPKTDIQHTLIQNINYTGSFLPNYSNSINHSDNNIELNLLLPKVHLTCIDHCVENYSWNQMMYQANFYAKMFGFHKFWSVDEMDVFTGETALRSIVMASSNGKIKMPINEPAKGKKKGQIEEFNDFNGGPGIQHIALRTNDIISTVSSLNQRGIEFNVTSQKYYQTLEARLIKDDIKLKEDFQILKSLNILVDYDPSTRQKKTKLCNYILQIFTKPLHDRPTLFIEIIQRHHHNGFGKGTFKGLFETIEEQQRIRGTLVPIDEE
ncbi:4-hydroxyphenylpyruvate dioxygenase [Scheffersomyces coipomensis]|uniref:4-hydroxyphenylpyruvate dioxygenase n=1 Tax=Scheffersomyces coipomensis TaxID=1788519 RepID=UPI00315CB335